MSSEDPFWPRASEWLAQGSDNPELVVVGVPTSVASISPSRADETPGRFRHVLANLSTFYGEPEVSLADLAVLDAGDWEVAGMGMESGQAEIEALADALPGGPVYAFIGGDNAITRPLVKGLVPLEKAGVITLDAHHDVRDLVNGPTNGTPIRGLFEDGLPRGRVAQIGIHSFANSLQYREYCEQHEVAVFTMQQVDEWGIEETVEVALDHLSSRAQHIYVDFDIDVLDRVYAPACPGSRPGGMTPRQLASAAFICGRDPRVIAADFVEVDATADVNDVTLMAMAHAFLAFAAGIATRPEEIE